jgi:putative ABC transport system permease protein
MEADENFVPTFQMQLAAGTNFLRSDSIRYDYSSVNLKVLVNEEVVKALGFKTNEDAIKQPVIFGYGNVEHKAEIIGVVKNYHQRSLREMYDRILYIYPSISYWTYLSVHINKDNLARNLASIETSFKNIFDGSPFEYFFLDEYFNNQYQADQRFGKVFTLFTVLAIFVACLGLLGLSSFMSRLRIKEIGIRKVLGASIYSILILFSKDFIKLVLLAAAIAIPLFYLVADSWLRNYAFHINFDWTMFVLPPLLLLFISLFTISIQSIKAALANPVESIHTE